MPSMRSGQGIPRENWHDTSWNPKGKETQNSMKAGLTPVTEAPRGAGKDILLPGQTFVSTSLLPCTTLHLAAKY